MTVDMSTVNIIYKGRNTLEELQCKEVNERLTEKGVIFITVKDVKIDNKVSVKIEEYSNKNDSFSEETNSVTAFFKQHSDKRPTEYYK